MHLCMLGHSCAGWSKHKPGFSPETACAVCPVWLLQCSRRARVELTRLQDMLRGIFWEAVNPRKSEYPPLSVSLRHSRPWIWDFGFLWVKTIVFIGLDDDKIVTQGWFCSSTFFFFFICLPTKSLTNDILKMADTYECFILVLPDISATFDTIYHQILG